MSRTVKRAFKFRLYPTPEQAQELCRTFGCVRLVYNSLARAISDAAWRELRSMLECKTDGYGRDLVVVDRWFPSSKLCSACGARQDKMPLNIREWECACGAVHDRDISAACNTLAAGLADR